MFLYSSETTPRLHPVCLFYRSYYIRIQDRLYRWTFSHPGINTLQGPLGTLGSPTSYVKFPSGFYLYVDGSSSLDVLSLGLTTFDGLEVTFFEIYRRSGSLGLPSHTLIDKFFGK